MTPRTSYYKGRGYCLVTFPSGHERHTEPVEVNGQRFFPTMEALKSALESVNIILVGNKVL